MPLINTNSDSLNTHTLPGVGNFQFSAVAPEKLGATEYTLVSVVIDITGSVRRFAGELRTCLQKIVEACMKSPRANNLLLRVATFNTDVYEIHGFTPLQDINIADYPEFQPDGLTALRDATGTAIDATLQYAKVLFDQDYDVNAIVIVITDGCDNRSHCRSNDDIRKAIEDANTNEEVESIRTILVGLHDPNITGDIQAREVKAALDAFVAAAGIDQFVNAGDATAQKLAKLADFVSQSISSQSQALGTGGPSQNLTF